MFRFQNTWSRSIMLLTILSLTTAVAAQEAEEIVAERSVFAKVYQNPEGTTSYMLAPVPQHYESPTQPGVYLDIDPTLVAEDGWRNQANSFPVYLPPVLGNGVSIEIAEGIRWAPGPLLVELANGEVEILAEPQPSDGQLSDEFDNAVVYPELYPGLDLLVQVRPGSLEIHIVAYEPELGYLPEEIDSLRIDAYLQVEEDLLAPLYQRESEGQPREVVPLYFGYAESDFAITYETETDIDAELIETYRLMAEAELAGEASNESVLIPFDLDSIEPEEPEETGEDEIVAHAVYNDTEQTDQESLLMALDQMRADGYRSLYSAWLETGLVANRFRLLPATGSRTAALTTSFRYTYKRALSTRYFLSTAPGVYTIEKRRSALLPYNEDYHVHKNHILVGKPLDFEKDRAVVPIHGIDQLLSKIDPANGKVLAGVYLGYKLPVKKLFLDSVLGPEYVIAASLHHLGSLVGTPPSSDTAKKKVFEGIMKGSPYTMSQRSIGNGQYEVVSTWATQPKWHSDAGKMYQLGPMNNGAIVQTPTETKIYEYIKPDLDRAIRSGKNIFTVGLAHYYDERSCVPCTDAHPDPTIQQLNGNLEVSARFDEIRMEVVIDQVSTRSANFTVTTPGDPNKPFHVYPGETLELDVTMQNRQGFNQVELYAIDSWLPPGLSVDLYQPVSSGTPTTPVLKLNGDSARIKIRWSASMPKQSSFELPVFGRFDSSWRGGTIFTPPLTIELKLPQLSLDIQPSPSTTVTMQDNLGWETFRTVGIVAGTDRGLNLLRPLLAAPVEWGSYPFVAYTDYWIDPLSISGSDTAEMLLMATRAAERLGAKRSKFQLRTCAHFNSIYGSQCSTKLISLPLQLTTAKPGGFTDPQYTEPRSTDTGTFPLEVTVYGNNLKLPNQRPVIYLRTPDRQTNVRAPFVQASTTAVTFGFDPPTPVQCGAYRVRIARGDGANANNLFNVTRPFRGNPHHFVMEAESGTFGPPLVIDSTTPKASNSQVVMGNGSTGKLSLQFRPPATASYRMWLRAMPHRGVRYMEVELHQVDPPDASFTRKTTAILNPTTNLATQVVKNGTTIETYQLAQGRTYELVFKPAPGRQSMSKIDMVIFTAGTQTPLNSELCVQ